MESTIKDMGFVYNATIFRVKILNSDDELLFFIRQIRKKEHDEFDGEIWGSNLLSSFKGKSEVDIYNQIKNTLDSKYLDSYKITQETNL